jgi:hypothetical protein
MKKFILAIAVAATMVAGQAQAGGYHGGHHGGYHHGGGNWVGPALAGAVVGAVIYNATRPVYVQQPQVIYAPQPQVIYTQPEYRQPPVYSQQYPAPSGGVSCTPLYDVNQQYRGCF